MAEESMSRLHVAYKVTAILSSDALSPQPTTSTNGTQQRLSNAMTRTQAVAPAFGLFAVWTLATYLLEARFGTFLRPDATTRFVYTVVANVLIGTVGAALVIRALVRRAEFPRVTTYGIAAPLPDSPPPSRWPLSLRDSF